MQKKVLYSYNELCIVLSKSSLLLSTSSNGIRYSSFSRTKSRKAFTLSFLDISLLSWKLLFLPLAVTCDFKVSSMKVESISSIRVVRWDEIIVFIFSVKKQKKNIMYDKSFSIRWDKNVNCLRRRIRQQRINQDQ